METIDSVAFDGLPVAGLALVPPWKPIQKILRGDSKLLIVARGAYITFHDLKTNRVIYAKKTSFEKSITGMKAYERHLSVWSNKVVKYFKFGNEENELLVLYKEESFASEVCAHSENHVFLRDNSIHPGDEQMPHKLLFSACFASLGGKNVAISGTIFNTVEARFVDEKSSFAVAKGHTGSIFCVLAAHGFIFSGSDDRTIRQWKLSDGMEHLKTYEGHSARIWSVDCNQNGILASGGENEVCLWNYAPEAGSAPFRMLKMDSMGAVWHIALAEKILVCGHQTGLVSRHNLKSSTPPVSESSAQNNNAEYEREALVVSTIEESIDKVLTTTADRFYIADSGYIYNGSSKSNLYPLNRHFFACTSGDVLIVAENESNPERCSFRVIMRNLFASLESTRNKSQILNAHARAIVELKHYGKPFGEPIPCEFYCVTSERKIILVKVKIGQVPKVEIISTKFELPDCKNPLPTAAMKLFSCDGDEAFAVGTCQGHINVYNSETNEAQKLSAHVGKGRHGISALRWKNGIWSCGNDGCVKQWTKTFEKGWICATVIRLKVESPIGFEFHSGFMYYYGSKGAEFHLYREEHRLISCWSGGRQRPTCFAFLDSPSTHSLVFVNKGRVHELDICAREVEANLNGGSGHTDKINSVEFATIAGKLVKVTTSDDCSVRLNGKQFLKPATMCASAMSAPDEKMIVCLGSKETVALYRYRARLDQFIAYEKIDVGRARKRDYDESGLARFTSAVLWNKNGSTLYLVAFCANSSARMFEIRLPRYEFEEVFSFKLESSHSPRQAVRYKGLILVGDSGGNITFFNCEELADKIGERGLIERIDEGAITTLALFDKDTVYAGGDSGILIKIVWKDGESLKLTKTQISTCGITKIRTRCGRVWVLTIDQRISVYNADGDFLKAFYTQVADPADFDFESASKICVVGKGMQTISVELPEAIAVA